MNTVVYYPYLYPTPEWLKVAALCWDKVYRLRPPRLPDDPEPIQQLDQAFGGILDSIDPATVARSTDVWEQFESWVEAREDKLKASPWSSEEETLRILLYPTKFPGGRLPEFLSQRGLARVESKPIEVEIPTWEKDTYHQRYMEAPYERLTPKPNSAHAKYEQLRERAMEADDPERADALYEQADAVRAKNLMTIKDSEKVVHLPKDIALHYLSLCAAKAAADGRRDLIAHREEFTDSVLYDERTLRAEVTTSVLEAYLPSDLGAVEADRIAELRVELSAQRLKYQREIQSLVDEFAEVASEGQLTHLKERIVEVATERVEETKKAYERSNLDIAVQALSISTGPPALATVLASVLGIGLFIPAGIAVGLLGLSARLVIESQKARSERTSSPWSYVLDSTKIG